MKKSVLILAVLSFLSLCGCTKTDTNGTGSGSATVYKGVVVKNICCQIAIQTFGIKSIGESWIDATTTATPVYTNSFRVTNPCDFGAHGKGDTINFKIVGSTAQTCNCCAIYTSMPTTAYSVKVVN